MSITITQKKTKQQPEALPKVELHVDADTLAGLSLEDLADRYGDLQDQISALKMNPAFAQFEEVAKQLQTRMEDVNPTDELSIVGSRWRLDISAAARNPRKLLPGSVPKLQTMLGAETFGKIAKVNLSDIEKYCTPDQVAKVVDVDTGFSSKRTIVAKHIG